VCWWDVLVAHPKDQLLIELHQVFVQMNPSMKQLLRYMIDLIVELCLLVW
jgi:hypothetical protein